MGDMAAAHAADSRNEPASTESALRQVVFAAIVDFVGQAFPVDEGDLDRKATAYVDDSDPWRSREAR
jgi:hypothetical protein